MAGHAGSCVLIGRKKNVDARDKQKASSIAASDRA
jgi:hypothetical protein